MTTEGKHGLISFLVDHDPEVQERKGKKNVVVEGHGNPKSGFVWGPHPKLAHAHSCCVLPMLAKLTMFCESRSGKHARYVPKYMERNLTPRVPHQDSMFERGLQKVLSMLPKSKSLQERKPLYYQRLRKEEEAKEEAAKRAAERAAQAAQKAAEGEKRKRPSFFSGLTGSKKTTSFKVEESKVEESKAEPAVLDENALKEKAKNDKRARLEQMEREAEEYFARMEREAQVAANVELEVLENAADNNASGTTEKLPSTLPSGPVQRESSRMLNCVGGSRKVNRALSCFGMAGPDDEDMAQGNRIQGGIQDRIQGA